MSESALEKPAPAVPDLMEKVLDRGWRQHEAIQDRLFRQGQSLGTWLVVGNAGALVLTVRGLLEGPVCAAPVLRVSALCFALGLILTMSAMMFGFVVTNVITARLALLLDAVQGSWINDRHIEELEKVNISVPDDAPLRVGQAKYEAQAAKLHRGSKLITWWGLGISSLIMTAGCLAFGIGLMRPLLKDQSLRICPTAIAAAEVASPATDQRK